MSTFPQVFRRSTFSTFDPTITRIYASTPHSISQHADFGLKYPVGSQKSAPRHIKVSNLDAGRLLGSDWISGDKEANFIKAFGTGRIPWKHPDELTVRRKDRLGELYDEEFPAPKEGQAELMDDVNTMTPEHFRRYLKRVRRYRHEYLTGKLAHLNPRTAEKLSTPEERTLVNLAQKGHVATPDTASFQIGLTKAQLDDINSNRLHSIPHTLHGLSYSRLNPSTSTHNPVLTHPGRALDRTSGNRTVVRSFRERGEGTNNAWAVSYGGLVGTSVTTGGTISEGAVIRDGVDYTRANPDQGSANFRVISAKLNQAPSVINVKDQAAINKWQLARKAGVPRNGSKGGSPLSTFKFDIQLESVSDAQLKVFNEVGTMKWTARDSRSSGNVLSDWSEKHGIAGPRGARKLGEGLKSMRSFEERRRRVQTGKENHSNILAILNRLTTKKE